MAKEESVPSNHEKWEQKRCCIYIFVACTKMQDSITLLNISVCIVLPIIADPPRFDAEELEVFKTPVTVKKGQKAIFKMPFIGREPIKVQWYLDGEELSDDSNIKLDTSEGSTRLLLTKLQRKNSGEIKIKLKNEFGTVEAFSQLIVLGMYTHILIPIQ